MNDGETPEGGDHRQPAGVGKVWTLCKPWIVQITSSTVSATFENHEIVDPPPFFQSRHCCPCLVAFGFALAGPLFMFVQASNLSPFIVLSWTAVVCFFGHFHQICDSFVCARQCMQFVCCSCALLMHAHHGLHKPNKMHLSAPFNPFTAAQMRGGIWRGEREARKDMWRVGSPG